MLPLRSPRLGPSLLATAMPLLFTSLLSAVAPAQAAPGAPETVKALHALFEADWQAQLAANPLSASYIGDTRYNALWPDLSPAARSRELASTRETLDKLARLEALAAQQDLPAAEQLNLRLFRRELQDRLAVARFQPQAYAMTAREGPQSANELAEIMPFNGVADYEVWLRRMAGLPAYLKQYAALLTEAAESGRTQPRLLMQRVLPQLDQQLVDSPRASPFYSAFANMPAQIAPAEASRLQAQAQRLIQQEIVPAYREFKRFFEADYLPACRETVGIWDSPEGAAYYQNRIEQHTTTTLTAEQIHQIGLREVARIQGEMQALMQGLGFKGTREQFFEQLRHDPRFYYATPEALFAAYVKVAKQIEPELPRLFGKLPRTPYGVRAIPMTSAPNTTAAYYSGPSSDGRRAGFYYVNLYRPEMRPIYEIEVLTTHEAVPGHHLQIALAQEQGELPAFRRFAGYNAYIEGWALYAETLGFELGLYRDPYAHFGQLTYDMWRAVRLVVDTGLHAKRWTREQAIDYFRANAAKTEVDIVNEVDRYIGWPGQALAYKIGQLRILDLRAQAQQRLGARFDVRAFHDMILDGGAVPLDVLDQKVQAWIAAQ